MSDDTTQPFAKTICSICHEHLKPIVENLQAISICGHVFHELCIQQWFEYCSKGKKKCPICKQTCSASNVSRLYFQSPSDSNDPNLSQKLQPHIEDPNELKLEVRRLEGKINLLNSALESRDHDLRNIRNELCVCKEQLKEEALLKNEALKQKDRVKSLLDLKTGELEHTTSKCTNLQERNLNLAKELAALKLVSDLDLEEDEIGKLASLGTEPPSHGNNSVEDILKKSLVDRNTRYKDLLKKFNALSSKEARSCKELEKAKEQLEKLKKENQKSDTAKKPKDNEVLRTPKASKKTKYSPSFLNGVDHTLNDTCTPQNTTKEPDIHLGKAKRLRVSEDINGSSYKDGVGSYISINNVAPKVSVSSKLSSNDSVPQPTKRASNDASYLSKNVHETSEHNGVPWHDFKDDDVVYVGEIRQDKPLFNTAKDASSAVFNPQEAADFFFTNGLLDATKRQTGKWCKNGKSKAASGDLIAVGADGKGGTIKILKSPNLSSHNSGGSLNSAKTGKIRAKASSLQSQGRLQIEHFFSKAGQ